MVRIVSRYKQMLHETSRHFLQKNMYSVACCCSVTKSRPALCDLRTAACQAFLSFTISQSLFNLMFIESGMPSNHLILCRPLLFLPSIFPSIKVFSSELALHIKWPKYWSFSISPSNEYSGLFPLGYTGWISLQSKGLSGLFSNTTVQKHQFFGAQLSLESNSHTHT